MKVKWIARGRGDGGREEWVSEWMKAGVHNSMEKGRRTCFGKVKHVSMIDWVSWVEWLELACSVFLFHGTVSVTVIWTIVYLQQQKKKKKEKQEKQGRIVCVDDDRRRVTTCIGFAAQLVFLFSKRSFSHQHLLVQCQQSLSFGFFLSFLNRSVAITHE